MTTGHLFSQLIENTISHYLYSHANNQTVSSIHFNEWRILPYTVIVSPLVGECYCEYETNEIVTAGSGNTLIVPPYVKHKYRMDIGKVHYAHIHYTFLQNIDILSLFNVPSIVTGADSELISQWVRKLSESSESGSSDKISIKSIIHAKALALELLVAILDASKIKRESIDFFIHFTKIAGVLEYIDQNIDKPITREELASLLSVSPTRFHYIFNDIMKTSPILYVNKIRLQKAQTLLASTDLSIGEVALKAGYPDIHHFSKQFKKWVGVSPSKYKENSRASFLHIE
ncbi:helix-turn-helix transcriptional regulator [Cohnella terricola]|uniref:Helix-turn-helix transcriptional regulator n=1 Tax=Cohnella terricola TaxID=1289167 RepID=A0A559JWF4_9BACL|nr:AraC family transcriptional regulator [Cohnella terricola]TVY04218.1 helix-turn-helix transcriptional regulator [Cohnella terricola]